jgi:hypothetical protein
LGSLDGSCVLEPGSAGGLAGRGATLTALARRAGFGLAGAALAAWLGVGASWAGSALGAGGASNGALGVAAGGAGAAATGAGGVAAAGVLDEPPRETANVTSEAAAADAKDEIQTRRLELR